MKEQLDEIVGEYSVDLKSEYKEWGWYENKNSILSEELTSKRIICIAEGKSDT
ncbi:hypothetical protein ACXKOW_002619 [Vibrio parahaemolyticus]